MTDQPDDAVMADDHAAAAGVVAPDTVVETPIEAPAPPAAQPYLVARRRGRYVTSAGRGCGGLDPGTRAN